MHRQIAGKLTGRVTKWIVLAFWIIAVDGARQLRRQAHRGPEQRGLVLAARPARSRRGPGEADAVPGPERHPDGRSSTRRSPASRRTTSSTMKDQAAQLQQHGRRRGQGASARSPPRTAQAAQTVVTYNLGADGWNKMPDIADEIHKIASDRRRHRLRRRRRWPGGRLRRGVRRARQHPAARRAARGHRAAAVHLPQPDPLDPADLLASVVALGHRCGLIYFLAKDAGLTVNGQSQAIVSILVIGAGTDYALLLVARYREELRRHEDRHEAMAFALHRATPAIIASAAHGHRRHALPDARRDELHRRARSGPAPSASP